MCTMGIVYYRHGLNLSTTDKLAPPGLVYSLESSPSPYTAVDEAVKALSGEGPLVGVRMQLVPALASDGSQVFCVLAYGTHSH